MNLTKAKNWKERAEEGKKGIENKRKIQAKAPRLSILPYTVVHLY